MYKLSYLFNGVVDIHKRKHYQYPIDTLRCLPQMTQLYNFNGLVTNTVHVDNKTVYTIDNVVEYTTVSEKTRQYAIKELKTGKNVGTTTAVVFGASGIASIYTLLSCADACSTGGLLTLAGCATGFVIGLWRRRQFSNELDKWKNPINEHVKIRRELPYLRASVVYTRDYIDKYLPPVEFDFLWKKDLARTTDKLKLLLNGTDFGSKLDAVHEEMNYSPFNSAVPISRDHVGAESVENEKHEFSILKRAYIEKTFAYEQRRRLINAQGELETEKIKSKFRNIDGFINDVYVIDVITGERVRHSLYRGCSQCFVKDSTYLIGKSIVRDCRNDQLQTANLTHHKELLDAKSEYDGSIAFMIGQLAHIYKSANAKFNSSENN